MPINTPWKQSQIEHTGQGQCEAWALNDAYLNNTILPTEHNFRT